MSSTFTDSDALVAALTAIGVTCSAKLAPLESSQVPNAGYVCRDSDPSSFDAMVYRSVEDRDTTRNWVSKVEYLGTVHGDMWDVHCWVATSCEPLKVTFGSDFIASNGLRTSEPTTTSPAPDSDKAPITEVYFPPALDDYRLITPDDYAALEDMGQRCRFLFTITHYDAGMDENWFVGVLYTNDLDTLRSSTSCKEARSTLIAVSAIQIPNQDTRFNYFNREASNAVDIGDGVWCVNRGMGPECLSIMSSNIIWRVFRYSGDNNDENYSTIAQILTKIRT